MIHAFDYAYDKESARQKPDYASCEGTAESALGKSDDGFDCAELEAPGDPANTAKKMGLVGGCGFYPPLVDECADEAVEGEAEVYGFEGGEEGERKAGEKGPQLLVSSGFEADCDALPAVHRDRAAGDPSKGRQLVKRDNGGYEDEEEDVCSVLQSFWECVGKFSACE